MKSKLLIRLVFLAALSTGYFVQTCQAQLWKKIKDKVAQTVSDHVTNDAGDATDKAIDKTEKAAGNAVKENEKNGQNNNNSGDNSFGNTGQPTANTGSSVLVPTVKTYRNYDFVPGDKIIFESNLKDEQTGEIPSQLTLKEGQMDVQEEDGENVIHTAKGATTYFSPRMSTTDFMPDQFTVEFDFKNEKFGLNHISIRFTGDGGYGGKDGILPDLDFDDGSLRWSTGDVDFPGDLHTNYNYPMQWHHIAIAVNKNQGKVYVDQYRVANVNNLAGKASSVYFVVNGYEASFIKNIRVAAGGIDIYKKVTGEAPIVMHGIQFDIDKATLKPESMGSVNQIYNLLKKDASLKFEIDGHTDNTGDAAHNLTLSQQRADAVKAQLVSMGIDASRLSTKGFGDTKPISDNSTPEGRANNRRVEFVKR